MSDAPPAWGAVPLADGRARFRLWAPAAETLSLRLQGRDLAMTPEPDGWFALTVEAGDGAEYLFVLPDGTAVPDPASRRQACDVHGPSRVTRLAPPPAWPGRPWEEAVIQEIHVGTFTEAGTFAAAATHLADLAALGVTTIEIMPVAQFGGDRGWGYDGVLPFAPHPAYGSPADLANLVAAAHEYGLMVLLDVVYNHFGPDGNYLHAYAPAFFDEARHTPWGAGIDYRRPAVRRFFMENALFWLTEYGFDGLRLDAIDQIEDPSDPELLVEIATELRARLDRPVHLTTEDNRNVTRLHERGPGGEVRLHTAEWNDDVHNAAHVLATGERDGYYAVFAPDPLALLGRGLAEGFAFQGETGRGAPSGHLPPAAFVDFLQNHDQTGNRAFGERLTALTDAATLEALTAILLLSPHIPLLFMGDEYGETRPFRFFAGFDGELGAAVTEGRRKEFAGFSGFGDGGAVPDPIDPETFRASRLDRTRRETPEGRAALERTRRLLAIRHARIVPRLAGAGPNCGQLLMAEKGALAVDWRLDGALLQLRATFTPGAPDLPPATGEEIHRTAVSGTSPRAVHWLAPTR